MSLESQLVITGHFWKNNVEGFFSLKQIVVTSNAKFDFFCQMKLSGVINHFNYFVRRGMYRLD